MARSTLITAVIAGTAGAAITTSSWGFGGPDLVICRVGGTGTTNGFSNTGNAGGIRAFAADAISCNFGDVLLNWDAESPEPDNNHPIFSQSMFRLSEGRLIQIGQSWAKHAGNSTNQPECGLTCVPPSPSNFRILVPGCCDAYNALINSSQNVGPKSEINPSTAAFPYPFCSPADGGMSCPAAAAQIGRRLQVKEAELPQTAAGIQYFYQIHAIAPDEVNVSSPRTDFNNASYRPLSIGSAFNITQWNGPTVSSLPAIKAWKLNGLGPGMSDPNVIEAIINVVGDGRFYLSAKATNIGGGVWQYDYAVMNYNSHRAGGSFTIPLPTSVVPSSFYFHDVDSHSGEPYSNVDWTTTISQRAITWATQPFATNNNANSLRWDSMYNFGFQCSNPPAMKPVSLGMFRPTTRLSPEAFLSAMLPAPDRDCDANAIADTVDIANNPALDVNGDGTIDTCTPPCPADVNLDGGVNVTDLLSIISAWGPCPIAANCIADVAPTPVGDGQVNVTDLLSVISAWGPCPGVGPPPPPPPPPGPTD